MYDEHGIISTGTAFFYAIKSEWFLITNWHNISGRNFLTKQPLTNNRLPTYMKAKFASYEVGGKSLGDGRYTAVAQRVDLYKDYTPVWYEHPTLGSNCDVIAIPISRPQSCPEHMHNAANLISKVRIPVKPGQPALIIGFPKSLSVGFGLPIWKSGYVASEPFFDISINGEISEYGGLSNGIELPAFFIDSQTREGMSGSPVFASFSGNWSMTDPYEAIDPTKPDFWARDDIALGGTAMEFIGCYSGRMGKAEEGAALGLCWRSSTIYEICAEKATGKNPHVA
jgi:hypothetical protein